MQEAAVDLERDEQVRRCTPSVSGDGWQVAQRRPCHERSVLPGTIPGVGNARIDRRVEEYQLI